MLNLFLPFVIGMALGIEPATTTDPSPAFAGDVPPPTEALDSAMAGREPEPQIPTGQFTTAIEIKQILGMTKGNWVAVRSYEGQDLVYFTHLLAWRCGLWEVRYGLNGAPATEVVPLEPCHEGTNQPNALTDVGNYLPYITLPGDSVASIYVELAYDDGTTDFAVFQRQAILMP